MAMKRFLLAVLLLLSTQLLPAQRYDVAAYLYPAYAEWDRLEGEFTIPYYPHVSIGWDNSPPFRGGAPCEGEYAGAVGAAPAGQEPGWTPVRTCTS